MDDDTFDMIQRIWRDMDGEHQLPDWQPEPDDEEDE